MHCGTSLSRGRIPSTRTALVSEVMHALHGQKEVKEREVKDKRPEMDPDSLRSRVGSISRAGSRKRMCSRGDARSTSRRSRHRRAPVGSPVVAVRSSTPGSRRRDRSAAAASSSPLGSRRRDRSPAAASSSPPGSRKRARLADGSGVVQFPSRRYRGASSPGPSRAQAPAMGAQGLYGGLRRLDSLTPLAETPRRVPATPGGVPTGTPGHVPTQPTMPVHMVRACPPHPGSMYMPSSGPGSDSLLFRMMDMERKHRRQWREWRTEQDMDQAYSELFAEYKSQRSRTTMEPFQYSARDHDPYMHGGRPYYRY